MNDRGFVPNAAIRYRHRMLADCGDGRASATDLVREFNGAISRDDVGDAQHVNPARGRAHMEDHARFQLRLQHPVQFIQSDRLPGMQNSPVIRDRNDQPAFLITRRGDPRHIRQLRLNTTGGEKGNEDSGAHALHYRDRTGAFARANYSRRNQGVETSARPRPPAAHGFSTRYGSAISAAPTTSGRLRFCFFP